MFRSLVSSRTILTPLRNSFVKSSLPVISKKMVSGAATNEDLKSSKLFDVSGYTAVVTGGGSGIGLMIAQTLQTNGATVFIIGQRKEALDKVVENYSTGPGKIIGLQGDINSKDGVQKLAQDVESQSPNGIHLLVNNAGIARDDNTKYSNGQPDMKSAEAISEHLLKSDPAAWAATFETNVSSQFFVSAAFLPLLAKTLPSTTKSTDNHPGFSPSIVNITSISGVMKGSSSGQFAYAASKAAFLHLTRMMATTFVETGIRVNSIAPGVFPSEMTTGKSDDSMKSEMSSEASNPSGRYGHETDVGACVLFLAGPASGFLNGQVVYPDGGNILMSPAAT